MSELDPGDRFGPYLVDDELGRGGMSVVYRAMEDSLARTVALKIMASHLHDDESYRMRFNTEARAAAAISHPHIIPIYSFGEEADRLYIAMQLIDGTDLRRYVESSGGRLDPPMTAAILEQAAFALDAIHARDMTHRDIKPDNILLSSVQRDGTPHVYLADFGLARAEGDDHLTSTGQILGTVTYAAPEQLLGEHVDGRVDVYALACVMFEVLTGTTPFPKNSSAAVIYAHVTEERPRVSERRPDLPAALDDVLAAGMAKHRDDRYRTATELLDAFRWATESWVPGQTPLPDIPPAPSPPSWPAEATPSGGPIPPATNAPPPSRPIDTPTPPTVAPGAFAAVPPATAPPGSTPPPTVVPATGPGGEPVPAPNRGGSGKVVAITVAATTVVLALVGGIVLYATSRKGDAGSAAAPATTAVSVPRGPTTSDLKPLENVVDQLDGVLVQVKRDRQRINETLSSVKANCRLSPDDAVSRIDDSREHLQEVINGLSSIDVSDNPDGFTLIEDLRTALERQASVDAARRDALLDATRAYPETVPPGCPGGSLPSDPTASTTNLESSRADELKGAFAGKYNALAAQFRVNGVNPNDL